MRSAALCAKLISCVAIRIVAPWSFSSETISSTSPTSMGSSAEVTSSRSSSSGSPISARQMATRCCWPPERRSGYSRAFWSMPMRFKRAMAFSSASARFHLNTLRAASVTLLRTVMCGKRLNC